MAAKQSNWPVNSRLRAQIDEMLEEIQNLQCALNFWLPSVPEDCGDETVINRIFHDANLLAGYDGPVIDDAETLGWIEIKGYTQRGEVMNPPVPAALGTEAGNLNTPHRDGTGAVPGGNSMGTEAQATQPSAAPTRVFTPRDVAQILCDNSPRCDDSCTHTSNEQQHE